MEQHEFDSEKGATPPVTAATTCWGTTFGASVHIYSWCPLPTAALAVIKQYRFALEERKIPAEADALLPCGLESEKVQKTKTYCSRRTVNGNSLSLATYRIICRLQGAIAYVVNLVGHKTLIAAVS